jgi:hypothetical protein
VFECWVVDLTILALKEHEKKKMKKRREGVGIRIRKS